MRGEHRVDVLRLHEGNVGGHRDHPRRSPGAQGSRAEGHRAGLAQVQGLAKRARTVALGKRAGVAVAGDHQNLRDRRRAGERLEHVLEHRDEELSPRMRVEQGGEALLGAFRVLHRQQGMDGRAGAHFGAPEGAGAAREASRSPQLVTRATRIAITGRAARDISRYWE